MVAKTKVAQIIRRLSNVRWGRFRLHALLTGRRKRVAVIEVLTEYPDWRLPQMLDLDEAVAAADCDEFASDAEVSAVFERYGVSAAPLAAKYKR